MPERNQEIIPFTTVSKTKYLGNKFNSKNKNLFNENYKPLKIEIEEDIRR
jgi:hypothetical protein